MSHKSKKEQHVDWDPPGFVRRELPQLPLIAAGSATDLTAYQNRAMEIARAQLPTIFQTAFTLWMIGSQLSFFTIIFLVSFGAAPLRNLFSMEQVFAPVSIPGVDLLLPKLTYIAINLVGVGIIMYKFQSMGLLPITSADWVSLLPERHPAEFSSLGVPLS